MDISGSNGICGFAVNHPRIRPRMPEWRSFHSFIRENSWTVWAKGSPTTKSSRIRKLHLELEDIQDLVGTALEQLGTRLAHRNIQVNIPAGFPLVPMDFTLMTQVLVNVLDNAVKYSPVDSAIEVSAELLDETVHIHVADRGVGIPPDDLSRVFDKFYRVQRPESVSGTGLGLSISKDLVEAHRGTIHARARENGGTVITIELPLH
jgi:two-component system sensor histidine kinase KdpD